MITDRSGGKAPPFEARAAGSFGNGFGKRSAVPAARWMASPVSWSMSATWMSLASDFTYGLSFGFGYFSSKNGPPSWPRLRKYTRFIEWQAAQTSR